MGQGHAGGAGRAAGARVMVDARLVMFVGVAALLTIIPGADTLLVVRNSLARGRRGGRLTVLARSLLLAGIHAGLGLVWLSLIAALTGRTRGFLTSAGARRTLQGIAGATLVGLGARLALSER